MTCVHQLPLPRARLCQGLGRQGRINIILWPSRALSLVGGQRSNKNTVTAFPVPGTGEAQRWGFPGGGRPALGVGADGSSTGWWLVRRARDRAVIAASDIDSPVPGRRRLMTPTLCNQWLWTSPSPIFFWAQLKWHFLEAFPAPACPPNAMSKNALCTPVYLEYTTM